MWTTGVPWVFHDLPWPSHDLPRLRWCRIDHGGPERELCCFSCLSGRQHHGGRDNGHRSSTNLLIFFRCKIYDIFIIMWYLLFLMSFIYVMIMMWSYLSLCWDIYIYYNMILSLVNVINYVIVYHEYTTELPPDLAIINGPLGDTFCVDLRGSFITPVWNVFRFKKGMFQRVSTLTYPLVN